MCRMLKSLCVDRSSHWNYRVSYFFTDAEHAKEASKASWRTAMDRTKYKPWTHENSACYSRLGRDLVEFFATYHDIPDVIATKFTYKNKCLATPTVVEEPKNTYDVLDQDVFYKPALNTQVSSTLKTNLSKDEVAAYSKYLIQSRLVPEFDVETFITQEAIYLPIKVYTLNALYFQLTLLRYMHEGQNLCRRMLKFHKQFPQIHPMLNVVMSHVFADNAYNSGHCLCDTNYIMSSLSYGNYDSRPKGPNVVANVTLSYIRYLNESHETKYDPWKYRGTAEKPAVYRRGHFNLEDGVRHYYRSLKSVDRITSRTWAAIIKHPYEPLTFMED